MIMRRHTITKWAIVLACWSVVAFFYTTQALIQNAYLAVPLVWWRVGVWELYFCLIWFAFTPLVLMLSERFPLIYGQILKNLTVYLISSIVFSLVHLILFTAGVWFLPAYRAAPMGGDFQFFRSFELYVVAYLHFCLISFWGTILVSYLFKYYRDFQERALRASQLEASLAQSQLQTLKSQLQPHFLFNTLNSISVLMQEDPVAANKMLVGLSELLRFALKSEAAQLVPLREELDLLRRYLEIEQKRFEDRLVVAFEVEPEILDVYVPNLILQPLVENAIRHGIAPLAGAGLITVRARQDGHYIELSVTDNGVGLSDGSTTSDGIGLRNTQERLKRLYGDGQQFELSSDERGGLQVIVRIPFEKND